MELRRKDAQMTSTSQDIMLEECQTIYGGSMADKGTC